METLSLHLPEKVLDLLDRLVKEKYFPNRSEAIRIAIWDLIHNLVRIIEVTEDPEEAKERITKMFPTLKGVL